MFRKKLAIGMTLAALAAPVFAQSLNVDFGQAGQGPPSTYGGAGQVGVWNSIPVPHTTANPGPQGLDYMLLDINGNSTGVGLHQFGGTAIIEEAFFGPGVPTGSDAMLLKDALVTHSIGIKTCLYFNGLQNGLYEVTSYAWMPNHPEVTSVVFHDTNPLVANVGGAWSGQHQEGVTFARHFVTVTNGFLGPHAGLPNGGNTAIGGPLNGIQLRKVVVDSVPALGRYGAMAIIAAVLVAGLIVFRVDPVRG